MSPFISPLALGLAAAGFAAPLPRFDAPGPDAPAAPAAAQSHRTAVPSDGPARAVILLSNGNLRFHEGTIVEEGDDYVLKHRSGTIRLPRRDVEEIFSSLEDVYAYKADQLPRRDPDEHMKLALWCVSQKLHAQAEEQLRAVLTYSPGDRRALGMLQSLQAAAERQSQDDQVVRTSIDQLNPPIPGRRDSEASAIEQIRAYRGPVSKPVIFDLPEPLAVRRFQEFSRTIHPILQNGCARCHDENSGRNWQLIRARVHKDLNNDLLVRTNLDATLALVNRNNPARSELLVNAVMPHGPDQKPILTDTNHPAYRALWSWVESLKADAPSTPLSAPPPPGVPTFSPTPSLHPVPTPEASNFGGGFAEARNAPAPVPPVNIGPAPPTPEPLTGVSQTSDRIEATHPAVPTHANFQTVSPLLDSGPNAARVHPASPPTGSPPSHPTALAPGSVPNLSPPPGQAPVAPPPATSSADPATRSTPDSPSGVIHLPDGSQLVTRPDGSQVLRLKDGTEAPILDISAIEKAKPSQDEAKKKAKEFQINPRLLEQFQKRNTRGAPGGG